MNGRELSYAIIDAMTPSRCQVVVFCFVFVWPWVLGVIHLLALAVQFAFRLWGWLT